MIGLGDLHNLVIQT